MGQASLFSEPFLLPFNLSPAPSTHPPTHSHTHTHIPTIRKLCSELSSIQNAQEKGWDPGWPGNHHQAESVREGRENLPLGVLDKAWLSDSGAPVSTKVGTSKYQGKAEAQHISLSVRKVPKSLPTPICPPAFTSSLQLCPNRTPNLPIHSHTSKRSQLSLTALQEAALSLSCHRCATNPGLILLLCQRGPQAGSCVFPYPRAHTKFTSVN